MESGRLLDVLLFAKSLYKKIGNSRATLFLGALYVGIIDILFPLLAGKDFRIFTGKTRNALMENVALLIASIAVIGFADILFFSHPMYDLFKLFKREPGHTDDRGMLIRLMKTYVLAHVLITPVYVLIILVANFTGFANNPAAGYILALLDLVIFIWFCAAITRGINAIYSFTPLFKRLVFVPVYVWNFILSNIAFSYMINNWIMKLFK